MKKKISNRLVTIASFIDNNQYIADIGADHGLLELFLVDNKKNIKIIAVENKKGPYERLKRNLEDCENVEIILSDGLTNVSNEIDTIVIAGMGGIAICNILEKVHDFSNVKNIIIDAHSDLKLVRQNIVKLGFNIKEEKLVFENNFYYQIIKFYKNDMKINYNDDVYEFGYKVRDDLLFCDYKKFLLSKYEFLLSLNLDEKQKNKIKNLQERIKLL